MEKDKDIDTSGLVDVTVNGVRFFAANGTVLGDLLRSPELAHCGLAMPCGGRGSCGKCKVRVNGAVSSLSSEECRSLTPAELENGIRLACRTRITGSCAVIIPDAKNMQILTGGSRPEAAENGRGTDAAFIKYGAAIDIGTTTLALALYDSSGKEACTAAAVNPQRSFGADVISRLEAALEGHLAELAALIRAQLSELIRETALKAGIDPADIDRAVITGNTAMLTLLTETNAEPLTHAPFKIKRSFGETVSAEKLGITALAPQTEIYLPPCPGAYVGADTVCAVLASRMCESGQNALLTDIGTNGETVLKCAKGLLACSTAAGPAFEGAGISMGRGAQEGAIDRVWNVSGNRLDAHVIGEKEPRGICGSGLVDALACLLRAGRLDESGYLEEKNAVIAPDVLLTQEDVRRAQLAKSAVISGMRTLLKKAGLREQDAETMFIAGGFGSYLNVHSAAEIGLIPRRLTERVNVLGNAALAGASLVLLSDREREKCERTAAEMKVVELAGDPDFAAEYIENMSFEMTFGGENGE